MLFIVMASLLLIMPKGELHIWLNGCHTALGDVFFKYYSMLAELPIYLFAIIPLFFRKYRWWTAFYATSEIIAVLLIQSVKFIFNMPRPARFFGVDKIGDIVPLVDGVNLHEAYSFPSGHTSAFFVFFTACALLVNYYYSRKPIQRSGACRCLHALALISLLIMAAVGGYSRIYLSQHFLMDVFVGSAVGITVPCLTFRYVLRHTKWIPNE